MSSNAVLPERGFLTQGDVQSHNLALFVQDAWTIRERLTLDLGLRAEKNTAYTSAYGIGSTAFDFGFPQKLAPASAPPGTSKATAGGRSTGAGASSTTR